MDFINSMQDLINYFQEGCKKEDQLSIGVEHEKLLFDGHSNQRVNFETITKVFNFLEKFGWKPIKEKNNVIALKREDQSITLEPGNQVELSGAKLKSIHLVCNESYKFLDELKEACKKINLKMMSVSFDPFTKLQSVPKTPKQRYEIMTNEMPKKGELSLHMMYQTCGTQINLDYTSEKDFVKKFKLSSFLVPISIAIFANSSIVENKNSGYLSYRSKVWQHTARAGLPKYFLEDMNFEKYADMAMKMSLLFVLKDSNYLNAAGKTFKDFVAGNLSIVNNAKPTIGDFKNHLATIFTEVRLKQYIEIRSLDTCEWDCHCAGPAFYTGLLYGNLQEAYEIINKWNKSDVMNAYLEAPKKGLGTMINNKSILEWSKILLNLSKKGLQKRNIKNKGGKDESIFLKNIENTLLNKKTKAEKTIEDFNEKKGIDFFYE